MLASHDMALQQAVEVVAIDDTHYLSRLFKKYLGLSYREYFAIHKRFDYHNNGTSGIFLGNT